MAIPDSIREGTPTRRELGHFLESGMQIRTPPASDLYRDNFDRIFGPRPSSDSGEAHADVVQPAECDLAKVEVAGSTPAVRSPEDDEQ